MGRKGRYTGDKNGNREICCKTKKRQTFSPRRPIFRVLKRLVLKANILSSLKEKNGKKSPGNKESMRKKDNEIKKARSCTKDWERE